MRENGENDILSWQKINDLLRGYIICKNPSEVIEIIDKFKKNEQCKLIKIEPRFGASSRINNQDDIIINFNFMGKVICEFQIMLIERDIPSTWRANRFI